MDRVKAARELTGIARSLIASNMLAGGEFQDLLASLAGKRAVVTVDMGESLLRGRVSEEGKGKFSVRSSMGDEIEFTVDDVVEIRGRDVVLRHGLGA